MSSEDEEITLTPSDVPLFEASYRHHGGYLQYRALIKEGVAEYIEKTEQKKGYEVVNRIVEQTRALNGRFLEKDNDGNWREVPLLQVLSRTTTIIRKMASKAKHKPEVADTKSPKTETKSVHSDFKSPEDTEEKTQPFEEQRASLTKAFQEISGSLQLSSEDFTPEPNDVLGGVTREVAFVHPGNQYLLKVVNERMFEYEKNIKPGGKMMIAYQIIQQVLDRKGRFLLREGFRWYLSPLEKAVSKTFQAFREALADHYGPKSEVEAAALEATQKESPEDDSDEELFSMDDFKPNDVLMGSGKIQREYPGTLQYLQWMRDFKKEYDATPKGGKSDIVYRVIAMVHDAGGRFLQRKYRERTQWFKVSSKRVFARTAQAIRELKLDDEASSRDRSKQRIFRNDRLGYTLINKSSPASNHTQQADTKGPNGRDHDENVDVVDDEATDDEQRDVDMVEEDAEPEQHNRAPQENTVSTPRRELPSDTSSDEEETGIETITPQDVLMGAGKQVREYVGTQQYLEWIKRYKEEYDEAPIGKKSEVVYRVISFVRDSGGRFLQKDGALWAKVPPKKVFARASQAFRDTKTDADSPAVKTGQPLKLLAGKMFKKRAPAGRYASLIQQAQESNATKAGTENEDDQTDGDETEESSDSQENQQDGEGDVSETETEDSFPMKRRKVSS
eukprot:Nitzschia sp. Nitz4//scaffold158_size52425//8032//10056//NITZ4_006852-RA/size52425-processed-gene-0.46-mRNA-1//-1//CDS//3329537492//7060//frame0